MGIGDWLKKAEEVAKEHSTETDEVLKRAEEFVEERTAHKFDEQIEKGVETVERTYHDEAEEDPPKQT